MFIAIDVFDKSGAKVCFAQIELDYGTNRWSIQEHTLTWGNAFGRQGTFEVTPSGEMWISDPANRQFGNMLILVNPPVSETDSARQSGEGRIPESFSPSFRDFTLFSDLTIKWSVPGLSRIRLEILRLCQSILPPLGGYITPPRPPITGTHPGIPGETNCGVLPGWIAQKLGSTVKGTVTGNFPDMSRPGKFKVRSFDVSLTMNILAMEQFAQDPDVNAWVAFDGNNRPLPGDFYVLDKAGDPVGRVAHVGVVIDGVGNVWRTADSGQGPAGPLIPDPKYPDDPSKMVTKYAKGFSAGYRDRKLNGNIITGEFGDPGILKGWINVDNPALFPSWATPRTT